MEKKRAPREQLLEAGKIATELLKKKGLQSEESLIDQIEAGPNAPVLPGIPSYLPRLQVLETAEKQLGVYIRIWQTENEGDDSKLLDLKEFWIFLRKELDDRLEKLDKDIKKSKRKKEFNMGLFGQKDLTKGIKIWLIDSFAVSWICKANDDLPTYIEWFYSYSETLKMYWPEYRELKKQNEILQNSPDSGDVSG